MKGKTMKYLAFDIEVAKETPEDAPDWKQYRPLGITCAATCKHMTCGHGSS